MPLVQFKSATTYGGKRYRLNERLSCPEPRAARLVAMDVAELVPGQTVSALFPSLVEATRAASPKRAAAPSPKVNVRLKSAANVVGQLRQAGDTVAVEEGRAAMLVAAGLADTPAGVSARFLEKVAELRRFEALQAKRMGGLRLATPFG